MVTTRKRRNKGGTSKEKRWASIFPTAVVQKQPAWSLTCRDDQVRADLTASLWKDVDTVVFETLVLTIYNVCMVQELCEQPGLSEYREEGEKKGELGTPLCVCS